MTDIVERLRELPGCHNLHGRVFRAVREAADEIERLRAEIVVLEATGAECADEIERLRAERLRAALQTAADALQEAGCTYAWAAAHAALLRGRHD